MENENVEQNKNDNMNESKDYMCNKCIYFHEHLMRDKKEKESGASFGNIIGLFVAICFCFFVVWLVMTSFQHDLSGNWEIRFTHSSNGFDVNYYDYDEMMNQTLDTIETYDFE